MNLWIDITIEGTYVPPATPGGTPTFTGTEVKLAVRNTTTDETTVFRGTEVVATSDDPSQSAPGAETPPAQGETVAAKERNVWHAIGVWSFTFTEEYKGRTVNVTTSGRANATGVGTRSLRRHITIPTL